MTLLGILGQAAAGAAVAGAGATPQSFLIQMAPLAMILVVFYFLLIRPQQQRMKAHQALLAALAKGDIVVTNGGIIGKVTKVGETEITVEVAAGTQLQFLRHAIAEVRNGSSAPATK